MGIQLRWKVAAAALAVGLTWSAAALATGYKGYLAVWQPGTGKYYWHSGMVVEELKLHDAAYFKKGMRIATIDTYKVSSVPLKLSYAAVWRPGSGEQRWRVGMSYEEFKTKDDTYFARGLHLASLDIQSGSVAAVWRPGVGEQRWRLQMSIDQLEKQDEEYFKKGLRLVMLKQHSDGFAAVWRTGSGGQRWKSGMRTSTFKESDQKFFDQGLRLVALDTYGGRWIAVWRASAGEQRVDWGLPFEAVKNRTRDYAKRGLRLVQLRAKDYETNEGGNDSDESSGGAGGGSSGGGNGSCSVRAVAVTDICYNLTGEPSTILQPGAFFAEGCGANLQQAKENAALRLAHVAQVCLTTPQEKRAGCCTYKFK